MTTIAYKNGEIAGDTLAAAGQFKCGSVIKVAQSPDGRILGGAAGDATFCHAFLEWIERGAPGKPPEAKSSEDGTDCGIVSYPDRLVIVEADGFWECQDDMAATGGGAPIARAFMIAGHSAGEAVHAAMKVHVFTGGDVIVFRRS